MRHPAVLMAAAVGEPDEYAAGHLQGAVNLPRGLLEFKLSGNPALERRDLAVADMIALSQQLSQVEAQLQVAHLCHLAGDLTRLDAISQTQPGERGLFLSGRRGDAVGGFHGAFPGRRGAGSRRLALQASRARIICFSTALWDRPMALAICAYLRP